MKKKTLSIIVFSILLSFVFINVGLCLDGKDMIRLKKGGISDETIQTIAREKTIETCSFTVQEILDLKNEGLKDKTIRMLIKYGSFVKDAEPVVYGKDIRSIQFTTAKDIIELKDAGVSDEVIQAIIIFGSRDVSDIERDKAWEMLKHMGIIIDMCEGSE
ncbi:MAG: hypothetical protein JRG68_02535 [Deltaproteobacteria bacterium]|nr:hypothetical protein [Deltaproteobacteria bacterium]